MAQLILTAGAQAAVQGAKASLTAVLARTAATTAASFAVSAASNALFGPRRRTVEGPRLESLQVQASTEGAGIPRVWGRARIAGQLIWAARFRETATETETGGKGGGGATVRDYAYSLSFAVGLCEGPIDRIGRVWADGKPFDLGAVNARIYRGEEDQAPDALIEAVEGAAPAFRGLAYVVFEDLPLAEFGDRIPQLAFEVERRLADDDPQALETALTAVTVIPGSGEFVYGTTPVVRTPREGETIPENRHNASGGSDFVAALDMLQTQAPNLAAAALVVSWFGLSTDMRACEIVPGVETRDKTTSPYDWRAGGVDRAGAHLVSRIDGRPAYGGTPADRAVVEAIRDLKARGLAVTIHPFVLMDAPGYPWRGRIASPADGTAGATADVAAFFGTARAADFALDGERVVYSGPAERSFRRFILHNAWLARAAGGVEAFLLGSELIGLTTTRDGAGGYPAVAALVDLLHEVRSVLGPQVLLSYGADWTEWSGHRPGGGALAFHLDPFWSDPDTDFIGIDMYAPLADWRDGEAHLDADLGGPYDRAFLQANLTGGEAWDWYYASAADRTAQARTPITDGAYGETWVWRAKDLAGWWSNPHHDRPDGVRAAQPTAWVQMSKPFRFTEVGCPAVDKGANGPNVFVDPKSTESALPPFSSGARDDLAQRRFLEAHLAGWRDPARNPVSPVYGGPMVAADRLYVYAWDARPWPFFPALTEIWGDGANWTLGHWLNGRLGRAPLDLLVAAIAAEGGAGPTDATALEGAVAGYVRERPMTPREAIDPLADLFRFDMAEIGDTLKFQPRSAAPVAAFAEGDLAVDGEAPFAVERGQAEDAPSALRLTYVDESRDYAVGVAAARAPGAPARHEQGLEVAAVLDPAEAEARALALLADASALVETARFALPPGALALDPGDAISVALGGLARAFRIVSISDGAERRIEAVGATPATRPAAASAGPAARLARPIPVYGPPAFAVMDLPLLTDTDDPEAARFAAWAEPWPGGVELRRDGTAQAVATASARAVLGRLTAPLAPGPSGRWTAGPARVALLSGGLAARADGDVLAGANGLAVETAAGGWEVLQFAGAELGEDGVWALTRLLRGQAGSEAEAAAGAPAGARVVLLTPAVVAAPLPADLRGLPLVWRAGPAGAAPEGDAFAALGAIAAARGLRPLSPAHLRARPDGAGGRALSWIRRTRVGGDAWTGEDAPLGEAFERYRVEIGHGERTVRRVEVETPGFVYGADAIAADFGAGGLPPGAWAAVAQLSDRVGAGDAARIALT